MKTNQPNRVTLAHRAMNVRAAGMALLMLASVMSITPAEAMANACDGCEPPPPEKAEIRADPGERGPSPCQETSCGELPNPCEDPDACDVPTESIDTGAPLPSATLVNQISPGDVINCPTSMGGMDAFTVIGTGVMPGSRNGAGSIWAMQGQLSDELRIGWNAMTAYTIPGHNIDGPIEKFAGGSLSTSECGYSAGPCKFQSAGQDDVLCPPFEMDLAVGGTTITTVCTTVTEQTKIKLTASLGRKWRIHKLSGELVGELAFGASQEITVETCTYTFVSEVFTWHGEFDGSGLPRVT